ncbi:MAG: hypothetical protein AB7V22_03625, partial [Kiritimatiellia bacterium]
MNIPRISVGALCALAVPLAFGQARDQSGAADANPALVPPLSLELAGSGTGFQYEQVPTATNVYAVVVSNGAPVLVSDSFLSLILQSGMSPDVQQTALQQYPAMVQDNFAAIMETTFPVKEQAPAARFTGIQCAAANGATMTVDQDDLAAPYVRIQVRDPNGKTESFSINRTFVEGLLAREETDGDKLLSSVTSFPFRLPESARVGFAYLTREQMDDLVLHMEAFQNQEIVRMPRFYREKAAEVLQAWSNRPAPPPVPTPAAADVPSAPAASRGNPAAA